MKLLDDLAVAILCESCGDDEVVNASSLLRLVHGSDPVHGGIGAPGWRRSPEAPPPDVSLWLTLPAPLYRSVGEDAARREDEQLALLRWEDDGGGLG